MFLSESCSSSKLTLLESQIELVGREKEEGRGGRACLAQLAPILLASVSVDDFSSADGRKLLSLCLEAKVQALQGAPEVLVSALAATELPPTLPDLCPDTVTGHTWDSYSSFDLMHATRTRVFLSTKSR